MSAKDNQPPRIDQLPTLQIVDVEVPDRLKELEDLVPLDPTIVDEDRRSRNDDDWRWN
jgi:hypothetical protein